MRTPKTLKEAIKNGMDAAPGSGVMACDTKSVDAITAHVSDFLAQKFGAAMLNMGEFDAAFGSDKKGAPMEILEELARAVGLKTNAQRNASSSGRPQKP